MNSSSLFHSYLTSRFADSHLVVICLLLALLLLFSSSVSTAALNGVAANAPTMDKTPHYSRVADTAETINAVTGRSIYYGMRPWRCDDRFNDWVKSFTSFDSIAVQFSLLRTLSQCARSEPGKEPIDNYHRLGRGEVMFYTERYRSGMMRVGVWETYPYDQNELRRVVEEDGLKMRVWRHQRELETESRDGRIDEVIQSTIFKDRSREK